MKLSEWRKINRYSQEKLAKALEKFVYEKKSIIKKLPQRTVASWEIKALPRRFWLNILSEFTKKQVTANDFLKEPHAD